MPTPAELHQGQQRAVAAATASATGAAWDQVTMADPQGSFVRVLPRMLASVTAGQLLAASSAGVFVSAALAAEGVQSDPVASVDPRRFAGLTSDGRSLPGLLTQPLIRTLTLRARGADDPMALAGGRLSLDTMVRTEIFDTGRDAVSVAAALDREVRGYVRVVNSPACGRCIVLAGRFYSRSTGFQRHPRCDCTMEPRSQVVRPGEFDQNPRELFRGMTAEQQNRAFGRDNAEVIRRGGDIGQVVNARRGMNAAGSNWTTEGATSRGAYGRSQGATQGRFEQTQRVRASSQREQAGKRLAAPRPSPGALLRFAKDPDEFALALERAGYL